VTERVNWVGHWAKKVVMGVLSESSNYDLWEGKYGWAAVQEQVGQQEEVTGRRAFCEHREEKRKETKNPFLPCK